MQSGVLCLLQALPTRLIDPRFLPAAKIEQIFDRLYGESESRERRREQRKAAEARCDMQQRQVVFTNLHKTRDRNGPSSLDVPLLGLAGLKHAEALALEG